MKKTRKRLLLAIFSAAICLIGAFLIFDNSSRPPLPAKAHRQAQVEEKRPQPIAAQKFSPLDEMKNRAHQEMLAEALRKKPDHIPVLLELAKLETDSGNALKASEYLRKALQYEPRNIEAKLNLGKLMFEMGETEEAIKLNQEILEIQALHPDALYNLGAIYGNLGNLEKAMLFWKQLIDTNPDSESAIRAKQMLATI